MEVLVEAPADLLDIYRAFLLHYLWSMILFDLAQGANRPDTISPNGTVNRVASKEDHSPDFKE